MTLRVKLTSIAVAAAAVAVPIGLAPPAATAEDWHHQQIRHVLLISVDGMHQSDLDWYVANHPKSELARLAEDGQEYTSAQTSDPSDSDPGGTALMTGGDPRVTGVYYDDEYSHDVFPAGTANCSGPVPGGDVIYDSPDDIDANSLDAGQGIPGLAQDPAKILQMTGHPQSLLVPSTFPVDPRTCKPIWPNQYLQVNTIFNVIHDAGLRTGGRTSTRSTRRSTVPEVLPAGTASTTSSDPRSTPTRSSPTASRIRGAGRGRTTTRLPSSTTPTRCRRLSTGSTAMTTAALGQSSARRRSTA